MSKLTQFLMETAEALFLSNIPMKGTPGVFRTVTFQKKEYRVNVFIFSGIYQATVYHVVDGETKLTPDPIRLGAIKIKTEEKQAA